jgi:hypothetical protein
MAFKLTKFPKELFYDKYPTPGLDSTMLLLPKASSKNFLDEKKQKSEVI